VTVYQILLIYQYLSLSGYQVLLQQSQVLEFLKMFRTHDPTHQKAKKNLDPTQPSPTQPNPTQPDLWVDPTHGQLWGLYSNTRTLFSPNCL